MRSNAVRSNGYSSMDSPDLKPPRWTLRELGNFFAALANELQVLGVTTVYSLEVPDIAGPAIRTSIDDLPGFAENLILLRYVERGSRLYRLISIMKVRDSAFDPTLHEFTIDGNGLVIRAASDTAEAICLASLPVATGVVRWLGGIPLPARKAAADHGRRSGC